MSRLLDVGIFGLIALLWGISFPVVEIGLSSFPPLLLAAFRFDVAGVLLLGYTVVTFDSWRPTTRGDMIAICSGGLLWIAVGNGVWFIGQALTSSVYSGVMPSLIPIVATVCSWLLLPDDRLRPTALVGVAISFIGALILVWPTGTVSLTADVLGKGLLLAGVVGVALGSVTFRWATPSLATVPLVAWAVLLGAVSTHLLSIVAGGAWSGEITLIGGLAVGYLGVVATAITYVLYFRLLAHYSAIEITLVTYLVPVIAAATSVVFFDESLSTQIVWGFVVVLLGFVLMKRDPIRAQVTQLTG